MAKVNIDLEAFRCKGRIKPKKGARPPFCFRIRREPSGERSHRVEFWSTRTGGFLGWMGRGRLHERRLEDPPAHFCDLVGEKAEASTWPYLNRTGVEFVVEECLELAKGRAGHPTDVRAARRLVDKLTRSAGKARD